MADPNTRQGKRTPVTLKIKFKSETLEQFIERYAVDVSQGGIFIRTKEPLAVGTQMKFEFQLRDASPLIGGEGTVVWTRENDPSRPAIAPGMGVRFDRLAEGSQGVLERILSEKAKQAPSRPSEVTKPPMFTDTPTRVAPAPVQDALLGRSPSGRMRADSFSETSNTPLPRPVPFHSDADDFDERAFEEATKVRSLDELAAASANAPDGRGSTTGGSIAEWQRGSTESREHTEATRVAPPPRDDTSEATRVVPPSESQRLARADSTIADPPEHTPPPPSVARTVSAQPQVPRTMSGPRTPPPQTLSPVQTSEESAAPTGMIDRDSAPGLPSPPAAEPKLLETSPSALASAGSAPVRTQLGLEMPRAATREPALVTPPKEAPSIKDAVTRPTGLQAVSSPKAETARAASSQPMPTSRRPSSAPIIIGILVALAGIGAAVWYFVLRDTGTVPVKPAPTGEDIASNAPPTTPPPPVTNGSNGSAVVETGSNGSAAVETPPPPVPAKATVDTVIASNIEKANVEILGEGQSGAVPFTAKLEKGKAYKVKVSAPRYADKTVDVKGGDAKIVAKLDPKPASIHVVSEPAGAQIYVDNAPTNVKTPGDVTLTAAQAARKIVHVQVRMAGKKPYDQIIETSSLTDAGDKLTASVDAGKLAVMVVVQRPPPPPPHDAGTGTGSNAGSAAGSDATPVPEKVVPPPTPPTPPPPAGNGSGEPEPDWTKKQ